MKRYLMSVLLPVLAVPLTARAEEGLPPGFDPQRHMRVSEVKDGMKGYGLSVFRGTKIERFDVEVVSVLRNFNPKDDVVLVRLKGANLDHTGSIAGMSGSPIFLKDEQGRERMIGAFAYGWPLTKDPLGGVQPIEYMLRMPLVEKTPEPAAKPAETGTAASQPKAQWSIEQVMPTPWKPAAPERYPLAGWNQTKINPLLGTGSDEMRMQPLATPLMTSGLSPKVFEQFKPMLSAYGLVPLQAGGAGVSVSAAAPDVKLEPGSAMAVPLMSGDMDMTAIGTCTEVVGNRVLGFGHSFFSEGEVSLPMSSGYIHAVIPNLNNSFKLGAAIKTLGTLRTDQVYGIGGTIGAAPKTVPIEIRCAYTDGTMDQTYHFNAAIHPRFTPILTTMAMSAAMTSMRDLPQHHTVDYDLTMEFANGQVVHQQNRLADFSPVELFSSVGAPIMAATDNPFERVPLKKISGQVRISPEARQAEILSVSLPKAKYRPGETLKAFLRYRPFLAGEQFLPLEFELPRDLPDGSYSFSVLDWQQHLVAEQAAKPFQFTAQSGTEVFDVLRDLLSVRHDAVYMRLTRQPDGVAIGRTAMSRLPSSRRRVLMGAGLSNTTMFVSSTLKTVAMDYVMSGAAQFTITIDKDAKVETARKSGRPEAPVVTPKVNDSKVKPMAKPEPQEPGDGDAIPGLGD
ncbi:MAG: hypothetical protein ACM359_10030 [Bacillota bacterium]